MKMNRKLNDPLFLLLAVAAGMMFAACSSSGQSGSNNDMYTTLSNQPKDNKAKQAATPPAPAQTINPALNNGYQGTPSPPNITDVEPGPGYYGPPPPVHGLHVNTRDVHVNIDASDRRMHIRVPFVNIDLDRY